MSKSTIKKNKKYLGYLPRTAMDVMFEIETYMPMPAYQKKRFVLLYWDEFKEIVDNLRSKKYEKTNQKRSSSNKIK